MRFSIFKITFMATTLMVGLITTTSAQEKLDRTSFPIQAPDRSTYSKLDVRNVEAPPHFEIKAPKQAPNVVIATHCRQFN